MSKKLNRFSARITEPRSQGASQAMLYGTGLTNEDMAKAEVGISSVWKQGWLACVSILLASATGFPWAPRV